MSFPAAFCTLLAAVFCADPVTAGEPPAWVEFPPQRVDGEYQIPVRIGPYLTVLECEANLRPAVQAAIDDYVEQLIGPEARGKIHLPWSHIEQHLIRERFEERRMFQLTSTQQGEMTMLHLLLGFDQDTNSLIRQLWRQIVGLQRVIRVAIVFGLLIWIMTVVWGYLHLDLQTHGRYRGRLRMAALLLLAAPFAAIGYFFLG
ncbi:MAG: hypothetical protein ACUVQR_10150 [Thermogutta sp.]